MAFETETVTCTECGSSGMVAGERCQACNGQGLQRRPAAVPTEEEAAVPSLTSLKKADLIAIAEERGLDTSGTVADLIERIEAAPAV